MQSLIWKAKIVQVLVRIFTNCQLVNKYDISEVGLSKHLNVKKEIQQITFNVCEPAAEAIFLHRHKLFLTISSLHQCNILTVWTLEILLMLYGTTLLQRN